MVVALVIFGPRKLPEIGRTIGKSLNEFRRASEDFKRTWQMEADLEQAEKQAVIERQENRIEANTVTPLPLPEVRDSDFDGTTQDTQAATRDASMDYGTVDNGTSETTYNETPDATPYIAETVPREPKRYAAPTSTETSDTAARS